MKAIYTLAIFTVLFASFNFIKAEASSNQENQKLEEVNEHQLNDEIRAKLVNLLLAELESESSNEQDDSHEVPLDKRMTYRYGKRMTYRYGKRSAMPYRFGKRSAMPSNQDIIEYLKANENLNADEFRADKRMSYRYGRSVDRVAEKPKTN